LDEIRVTQRPELKKCESVSANFHVFIKLADVETSKSSGLDEGDHYPVPSRGCPII
jgi:hypothetical protein